MIRPTISLMDATTILRVPRQADALRWMRTHGVLVDRPGIELETIRVDAETLCYALAAKPDSTPDREVA